MVHKHGGYEYFAKSLSKMREAIILAGGFGTRLRKLVADVPKSMAPVAGRPFLEIVLSTLAEKGFSRVVLSLGFMAETIISHFKDCYAGLELEYVVEEKPLGTGGALRLAITRCDSDHVYVFNGDTYLDLEVEDLECQWQDHHNPIIVGREVPDATRYGRLIIDEGRVIGFAEKGVSGPGLINAGCYVLNHNQLDDFPLNEAFSFEIDYLTKAVNYQTIDIFITHGYFIDIGVPEDFHRAQIEFAGH